MYVAKHARMRRLAISTPMRFTKNWMPWISGARMPVLGPDPARIVSAGRAFGVIERLLNISVKPEELKITAGNPGAFHTSRFFGFPQTA